jgi:hypothetical protein
MAPQTAISLTARWDVLVDGVVEVIGAYHDVRNRVK